MQTATATAPRRSSRLAAKASAKAASAEPVPEEYKPHSVTEALAAWQKISAACAAATAAVEAAKNAAIAVAEAAVATAPLMNPKMVVKELREAWDWYVEIRSKYMAAMIDGSAESKRYLGVKTQEAFDYLAEWTRIADSMGLDAESDV